MPYVDEKLLARLVDKYGLERQKNNMGRSALWGKVTKEYNQITGNTHSKARLSKKWQNIVYQKKTKSLKDETETEKQIEEPTPPDLSEEPEIRTAGEGVENIWSACQYALRDLFLFLIQRHNLDEESNPKIRNELWKKVAKDFHRLSGGIVYVRHEKFTKKWQNWKQYNKSKGKPHPFQTCGRLDWDVIKEKLAKLKERAVTDEPFAAALARESGEDAGKIKFGASLKTRPGAMVPGSLELSSSGVDPDSNPKVIEKEIYLEMLNSEQERFRQIVENGRLEKEKLLKETDLVQTQLELAKAELALKLHMCQSKGVVLYK